MLTGSAFAQQPVPRIVFQMASGDTTVHSQMMKQLNNILKNAPTSELAVVCHGPGLDMLVQERSVAAGKIPEFIQKGITFVACEFTMQQKNITHEQLIRGVISVPAAVLYISEKQQQNWTYIKAGF
jgi:intracellular sulfur oxidation DsrE/DsrF family protein